MANVDRIIQYEAGELDQDETVELFQELVNDGTAWQLQGHYGRTAARLIEAGLVRTPARAVALGDPPQTDRKDSTMTTTTERRRYDQCDDTCTTDCGQPNERNAR